MRKKIIGLCALVILAISPVFSQDYPTDAQLSNLESAIPKDPNIIKGKLDNGLTYYIKKNTKPEKRLELRLVVNAGSILEKDDQRALAHFMEHMCFNGTKNFAKNDLIKYLESVGVKFGADLNAYTSFDETVYILPIPTDDEKIVDKGFQILEDWAHNVTLNDKDIDDERGVILEEWRTGRGAAQRMRDKYLPLLLKDSRYAERIPIGTKESIENFKHDALRRFYHDWYRPDLMAVVAVGDIDVKDIEQKIKDHFGKLTNPANEPERKYYPVPDQDSTYISILSDKEAAYTNASVYYKTDVEKEKTLNDYRNNQLKAFYTGMLNQRLAELTQQKVPPFIYASTAYGNIVRTKDAYIAQAYLNENYIKGGLKTLLEENERVKRYGFTQGELDRFKKDMLNFYEQAYNERDKSESRSYAAEFIRNFLQDEPIPGIAFEYAFMKKYIDGIKLDEINKLSDDFLKEKNRVVVITAPQKEGLKLPGKNDVFQILGDIADTPLSPYRDSLKTNTLMEQLPKPGKVTSESHIDKIGVTEWTLSNGAHVILKPTDFKNDQVLFSAFSFGGQSLYPDSLYESANNADGVVSECGVDGLTPTDIQKILAGKNANVRPYIGTLTEGMNGSCTPKDMKSMFQLINLYFTQPRKDTVLFTSYINRSKSANQNLLSQPNYYFMGQVQKVMTQNNPRGGRLPRPEDFDKIKLSQAINIYKQRFANASDFYFYFVGNFTLDSVKSYVDEYIASLPSTSQKETWKDLGIRPPKGIVHDDFYKGADERSSVSIRFHGHDSSSTGKTITSYPPYPTCWTSG